MERRSLLMLAGGVAASMLAGRRPALADLEPDGMYLVYRRYALQVVGQRGDEVAEAVIEALARFLPETRARLARAVDARRIGVLIGTNQQDVAVMDLRDAEALFLAKPPFADIRALPLRAIVALGNQALVCRSDFPPRLGFLLARTLVESGEALPTSAREPEGIIPVHPGSRAFFAREGMPSA